MLTSRLTIGIPNFGMRRMRWKVRCGFQTEVWIPKFRAFRTHCAVFVHRGESWRSSPFKNFGSQNNWPILQLAPSKLQRTARVYRSALYAICRQIRKKGGRAVRKFFLSTSPLGNSVRGRRFFSASQENLFGSRSSAQICQQNCIMVLGRSDSELTINEKFWLCTHGAN